MGEHQSPVVVGVLACFLVLALVSDNARGMELTITPDNPTETVDNNVHISCTPGKDSPDISEIIIMVIAREDAQEQVAALRDSGVTFQQHGNLQKRYEANGLLSKDVSKTYLNVTLLMPRVEDSGYYSCAMNYLDVQGILIQSKYSARLVVKQGEDTVDDKSLQTFVAALQRRVDSLEASDQQGDEDLKELQTTSRQQKDEMRRKYQALENRVNYKSVFSATIKEKVNNRPLSPNMVIVFDDVILREGRGYDETRGVFTAQTKGLYAFHLVMGTWSSSQTLTDVTLNVNGQVKVSLQTTNFNSNNGGDQDQAEASLVAVLEVGDRVKVVTSGDTTGDEQMVGERCWFSGYLVRTDG